MPEDWPRCPETDAARYRKAGHWAGVTFGALLRDLAARHGPRTAVVDGAERWSYADLDAHADRLCAGLDRAGIRPGERVVVQLPNRVQFLHLWFALTRLGAVPVHAMPAHRHAEIRHLAELSGATTYVVADRAGRLDGHALARQVRDALAPPRRVIVLGDPGGDDVLPWSALLADGSGPVTRAGAETVDDAGALAMLLLSGGSTGVPKLIPRTHDEYLYAARQGAEACELGPESVYLVSLPIGFNFAFGAPGVLGTLSAGGTVVIARDPSPHTALRLIERERVTVTALTPPLVPAWIEEYQTSRPDLSSLRVLQVGGARLADDEARRVETVLGVRLQQVFGMAEGLVNYTRLDDADHLRHTTQGRPPSAADEVLVVDAAGRAVPDGEVGELLTRGPATLRGYYRAPDHNARAFTADGFYRTGDLVRRLPSGHLVVVGRVKEQINRGGEKIATAEVEEHLRAHPRVRAAALVAAPDPHWGECAVAFLVCDGDPPGTRDLARYLAARGLAGYKAPDRVHAVPDLPLTPVGKIDKVALARLLTPPAR
ncbi:Vibriobactin-specific 2,3-dihydroxybenzoate-AMP ligase [Candidatus Protofrankia californiensis]|uniref:Vibriobactin-specific 2,3-dihydroxybenzoate-AMP ligase n=1 Tax=Candidatus Protofrankia californiensis TaxID=1839754 RepID=A0A1C3PG62_9ACTN|nr:Vibriobactin-specific 2,3-dihydroxybenzoate-AMP ligase [Candidatus Protofrankia californiensis]